MAQRLSEQLHTFFGKVWKSLRKIVGNMQKQLGRFQKLLSKQEENLMHQLIWLRKSWQVYTPISIKVASKKNDAWSMFHSPRCTIVASLVNYVPATTSLETQKANAANAFMLRQQNVKTMYFKTLNPRLFNLRQWFEVRFFSVVKKQMLQTFNEFTWLLHVEVLDGVFIYILSIFEAIFLKLNKKRIALIYFIEITSILAH